MSLFGQTGRVGAVVLLGVALLIVMYAFFNGGALRHTYTIDVLFNDATGASKDVPVTIAGVQIGRVKNITLTPSQMADLTLEIQDKIAGRPVQIPIGSKFSIVTPILGSTGSVVVTPPTPTNGLSTKIIQPGAKDIVGERSIDLSTAFSRANTLLSQLSETTKRSDKLIDTLTKTAQSADNAINGPQMKEVFNNFDQASDNGLLLTEQLNRALVQDNSQIQSLLAQTQKGAHSAIGNINTTTAEFRSLAVQNHDKLNNIIADLQDTTSSLAGITGEVNETLHSGNMPQNLQTIVQNLKTASGNLAIISTNFQKLSSDQGVQGDLKETLHNIRESSEQTNDLLMRLNEIAGTKPHPAIIVGKSSSTAAVPATAPTSTPPYRQNGELIGPVLLPRLDLVQNLRDHHFRADLDAILPIRGHAPGAFGRAGIYGVGGSNRGILQYGEALDPNGLFDWRAGIYRSKLSVGFDYGLGRSETFSLDAWDPNNYKINASDVLMLNDSLGLLLGEQDVTHHASPTIGLEYRH